MSHRINALVALVVTGYPAFPVDAAAQASPTEAVLAAFDDHRIVAVGENHGHVDFHDWIVDLLADPRAVERIDDIAVEWGNALYQDVVDRYVAGGEVPWDSVTMAWRNTIVSPNTVWDAPVYEAFFRAVRRINEGLPPDARYRVLLADSPVDWTSVGTRDDLAPFYDRASSMADVVRRSSLLEGRRALFLAGGLHVSKRPRVRPNRIGVPVSEITPVAWLELRHPGVVYVIASFARDRQLDGLPEGVRASATVGVGPRSYPTASALLRPVLASSVTTLRNRDGSTPDVYGSTRLHEIVDAVIVWPAGARTFAEPGPAAFADDWYWDELDRRSRMLFDRPMDLELRGRG